MACQPEEGVASDCPCAKKRLISSSLANSARIVVFPKTHLHRENRQKGVGDFCAAIYNLYIHTHTVPTEKSEDTPESGFH